MRPIDVINKVAHKARPEYKAAIEAGDQLFVKAGITTPLRLAHFLAQILHESGGLTITAENMNYTAHRMMEIFGVNHHSAKITEAESHTLAGNPPALAERVYGLGNPRKAKELGNLYKGDGYKYRGQGILQTTGGGAYKRFADETGVDFYNHPELVFSAQHALKPALLEWTEKNCNKFADENDILTVTKRINGGTNGMEDRKHWFNVVWPIVQGQMITFSYVPLKPTNPVPTPSPVPASQEQEQEWTGSTGNTPPAPSKLPSLKTIINSAVVGSGTTAATTAHTYYGLSPTQIAIIVGVTIVVALAVYIFWKKSNV